jgi:hypothetical protein
MNFKKLGFTSIVFIFIISIYYLTAGSEQIISKLKSRVNSELTTLQQHGFTIKQRDIKDKEEFFVISFDNPDKITDYLNSHNANIDKEDIELLKGASVAVDTKYLNDSYSLLSFDIYPHSIPKNISDELNSTILTQIDSMIKNRTILLHIDFNKFLSEFKGYIKDIDGIIEDEMLMHFVLKGVNFQGELKDEKLKSIEQNIKYLSLSTAEELNITLSNFDANYKTTDSSSYNTQSNYGMDKLKIYVKESLNIEALNLEGSSATSINNKLLKSSTSARVETFLLHNNLQKYKLKNTNFSAEIDNIDINALEQLQNITKEDNKTIKNLMQQIVSRGIEFNISELSSKEIFIDNSAMGSFNISISGDIDKDFNLTIAEENPFLLFEAINSKSYIATSTELFSFIMQDPRAMIALMMFPPKEEKGQKIYEIEYHKGKLTVNGTKF